MKQSTVIQVLLSATLARPAAAVAVEPASAGGPYLLAAITQYDDVLFAAGIAVIMVLVLWRRATALRAGELERLAAELEESREALRAREERYRSLVENASDTVSILDREGAVLYQSPSIATVFGWDPDELQGRSAFDFVHPDDQDRAGAVLAEVLDDPDVSVQVELRFRTPDGSWRDVEVVATNRLDDPAVGGVVCNARDVTHHNTLKVRLRQADRLETVGRLAGGVAHDFNNILTALRGHAEIALQEMPADAPGRADVQEIVRNAGRASDVTRQLLAFTRQQIRESRVVSAATVVREMLPTLRRLIGEDIEVATELAEKDDFIHADPAQIEQVVLNLVINARDAMPDGGRISLEVFADELTPADDARYPYPVRPGQYVHIRVSDTGTGMDEEVLGHVFEPFFTTKQPGEGTGLGLASVYGVVKQSWGYIWAHSEPGEGTRFDIYLPRMESDAAGEAAPVTAHRPATAAPTGSGETVLLVEDEDAVRSLAARVLRKNGYQVIEAVGADDALLQARESTAIDLLLTDVVMPGMSGVRLAERLRELNPGLPVLLMSGYTAGEVLDGEGIRGAALLEKPFTPDQFLTRVREILCRTTATEPEGVPAGETP